MLFAITFGALQFFYLEFSVSISGSLLWFALLEVGASLRRFGASLGVADFVQGARVGCSSE